MREPTEIQAILEEVAGGGADVDELLPLLCDRIVFAPVVDFESLDDSRGTNRIVVAHVLATDGRKLIPAFTDEELFLQWADGEYQCFSVTAADLALTLPKDNWLWIDPGTDHSCQLTPEEVRALAVTDPASLRTELARSVPEEVLASHHASTGDDAIYSDEANYAEAAIDGDRAIYTEEANYAEEAIPEPASPSTHLPANEYTINPSEHDGSGFGADEPDADVRILTMTAPPEFPVEDPAAASDRVTAELLRALSRYDEVQEAYFIESRTDYAHGVLGLLTDRLDAEKRFLLIDEIAEISRRCLGAAGAIEVYDDLDSRASTSWELFNALTPFYLKEDRDRQALVIERTVLENESQPGNVEEQRSFSWRKTRSKLLGALVGRN